MTEKKSEIIKVPWVNFISPPLQNYIVHGGEGKFFKHSLLMENTIK